MIPNKLFVFSGYLNGTFIPFNDEMYLGNSINVKAGLSKEITDKLNIGISVNGGVAWKYGTDWSLGFNCGFVYDIGKLGFMQDFRYGVSLLNLERIMKLATIILIIIKVLALIMNTAFHLSLRLQQSKLEQQLLFSKMI